MITSVLIVPNHRISTTEKTYPHEKTPPKGRQEAEQDRLYQGQMHSRGEGTDPLESCERGAEILRLLSRDVAGWIRHRHISYGRQREGGARHPSSSDSAVLRAHF